MPALSARNTYWVTSQITAVKAVGARGAPYHDMWRIMMMLSNRYRRVAFYSGDQPAQSDGRAISDDDLCAWCAHLHYCPGETSMCAQDWPCERDEDGYSQRCEEVALIPLTA